MVNAKTLDLDQLFAEEYIKTAEDVWGCMQKKTTNVRNTKQYLLSALYSAASRIGLY